MNAVGRFGLVVQQFPFWIKPALRYPIEGQMPTPARGPSEGVPSPNSRSTWRFRRQGILKAKRSLANMRFAVGRAPNLTAAT